MSELSVKIEAQLQTEKGESDIRLIIFIIIAKAVFSVYNIRILYILLFVI